MTRHAYKRVRTGKGRRENITISGCSGDEAIAARGEVIRQVADELVAAGRADRVKDICMQIGAATTDRRIEQLRRAAKELIASESAAPDSILFSRHAEDWTTGELHRRFPDYVRAKDSRDDRAKLREYINPNVGDIPLVKFTIDDANRVMRKLPDWFSSASRRHVAQVMYKLCRYAVYPCKIIAHNPLPVGFLPKIDSGRAKQYLYPDEDAQLLRCEAVPFVYRLAYGVLAREGMRTGELIGSLKDKKPAIAWDDFDLKRGLVRLDVNKTDDPRAWALDAHVADVLRAWKRRSPREPFPGVDPNHFADRFRDHLVLAKIERSELRAPATKARRPIRGHDLRATFITVALANGRTEGWIQDRTGHTSSAMLNRYRRLSRQFSELRLGELGRLDELLPEFAQWAEVGVEDGQPMGNREGADRAKAG